MIETIFCTIGGILVGLMVAQLILSLILKRRDKKEWNDGVCRKCGKPWRFVYHNRKGERAYKCENNHWCEVYYDVDGRKKARYFTFK